MRAILVPIISQVNPKGIPQQNQGLRVRGALGYRANDH